MVSTGLRLVIGSWKIMAISLPRTSCMVRAGSVRRSRPASLMLPWTRPLSCGIGRIMESAVTLFPEPDSPTIATVSFAAISNETFRTTGNHCPSRMNEVVRPEIDSTPNEVAARGGVTLPARWSVALGPILIVRLSQDGFSTRVQDRRDPAGLRRGGGDRWFRARIRPPPPASSCLRYAA
jgi:hypothetical protein